MAANQTDLLRPAARQKQTPALSNRDSDNYANCAVVRVAVAQAMMSCGSGW